MKTIPRRQQRCSHCNTPFEGGACYFTVLTFTGSKEGERKDFCEGCKGEINHNGDKEIIFWQGRIALKSIEESPEPVICALDLLRELCRSEKLEDAAERAFLLALFLLRRRQLVLRHRESAFLWYEVVMTGELLAVPDVAPRGAAAEGLQLLLKERLALVS